MNNDVRSITSQLEALLPEDRAKVLRECDAVIAEIMIRVVPCKGCETLMFRSPRHRKFCTPRCENNDKVRRFRLKHRHAH